MPDARLPALPRIGLRTRVLPARIAERELPVALPSCARCCATRLPPCLAVPADTAHYAVVPRMPARFAGYAVVRAYLPLNISCRIQLPQLRVYARSLRVTARFPVIDWFTLGSARWTHGCVWCLCTRCCRVADVRCSWLLLLPFTDCARFVTVGCCSYLAVTLPWFTFPLRVLQLQLALPPPPHLPTPCHLPVAAGCPDACLPWTAVPLPFWTGMIPPAVPILLPLDTAVYSLWTRFARSHLPIVPLVCGGS